MGDAAEMAMGTEDYADQNRGSSGAAPGRLSLGSIGGLQIRKPQERMPTLNALIYGDSGAGKTLLAGTAAFVEEMSPMLLVDVEGGTLTLNQLPSDAQIDIVSQPKWKEIQKIYDQLYAGKHPYKTVAIDSFTEVQNLAMNSLLGNDGKMTLEAAGNLPEFKEWRINTEQIRNMARAFRDLPINTIFTALADEKADPRTANSENPRMIKNPSFTKKLALQIPAFFDLVFYMYVKARGSANIRYLQTDKDNSVVAKCRVPGVPMLVENPTMENLFDMLIRNPGKAPATPAPTTGGMARRK